MGLVMMLVDRQSCFPADINLPVSGLRNHDKDIGLVCAISMLFFDGMGWKPCTGCRIVDARA